MMQQIGHNIPHFSEMILIFASLTPKSQEMTYTKSGLFVLVLLRVAIGWHFLYEGASKLLNPSWTSKPYLMDSQGIFSGIFRWMAEHESRLAVIDAMNEWGLTLIGLGLILGVFTRLSTFAGIILLAFYYLSHPSWPGLEYLFPAEGSYFIVNKNLVEICALLVLLYFPTGKIIGIDRFLSKTAKTD
jgi:thiosulfate dehydrogenase [quinone] large subunit